MLEVGLVVWWVGFVCDVSLLVVLEKCEEASIFVLIFLQCIGCI